MCSGVTENATQIAKNDAAAAAHSRPHHGRTRAGAIASTTSANGRPPPERGSSKRSQSTARTKPATPDTTTVLRTCSLGGHRSFERGCEVVAATNGRDRNAAAVQAQQERLGTSACAVEARRIDEDERDPPS